MSEQTPRAPRAPGQRSLILDRLLALAGAVGAAVSVALAVLIVVIPSYAPCSDAGAHLLSAVVKLHPERFAGVYEPQAAWTGQSYVTLTWLVAHALPVGVASRAVMALGLLAHLVGLRAVARRAGANEAVAISLGAIGFVGWIYAMGFFSFSLATAFGACAWAAWVRRDDGPGWRWLCSALLVGAAWSHAIAAVLVLAHLVLVELLRGWPVRVRAADAATLLPGAVWTLATSAVALRQYAELGVVDAMPAAWLPPLEAVAMSALGGLGSFSRWAAAPAGAVLVVALVGATRAGVDESARTRRAAARAALVWSAGFFVLPFHGLGWFYASPRVLYFASAAAPAAALGGRAGRLAGAAVALLCASSLLLSLPAAVSEGRRIGDLVGAIPADDPGRIFTVVYRAEPLDPVTPYATPILSTPYYAAIRGGGAIPGAFAFPSIKHSIRFAVPFDELFPRTSRHDLMVDAECRADPSCAAADAARADMAASQAVRWDTLLAFEAPPRFVERLVARGFVPANAALVAFRPQPATLDVRVPSEDLAVGEAVVFRAGYPDTIGWFRGGTVRPGTLEPSGLRLRFDAMPAGPVRVEVFADRDGDGEPGAADLVLFREVAVIAPGSSGEVAPQTASAPGATEGSGAGAP